MWVHTFLKPLLKRGAVVAAANWQVTLVQATADSLFKLLVATPVIGGVFLVALVLGSEPQQMMSLEWREMATTIVTSLLAHPVVLVAFLLALGVVVLGGSLLVFLIKGGTVAVLIRGERQAVTSDTAPLHLEDVATASAFTPEFFIAAAEGLFPRYLALGSMLIGIYLVSGLAYLSFAFAVGLLGDGLGLAALATLAFVGWITIINLIYLLIQIVIAADDCSVATAVQRVAAFMARERRRLLALFLVVLVLVVMATGASFVATFALGLIGFVPFVGLAVLPIQLLAWIFRGLVFQFLGLSSIGAYLRLYRMYSGDLASASSQPSISTP